MNITVLSVVGGYYGTLPHMLNHYRKLGVGSVILNVVMPKYSDDGVREIQLLAKSYDATVGFVAVAPWFEGINPVLYRLPRVEVPDSWYILADADEFHEYPDDLSEVLAYCDRKGYTYIEGCLLDRISETGRLKSLTEESISDQFPIGTFLTGPVLGGVVNKIVAVKGPVTVGPGQHHAHSGVGCPPSELYVPVHHFKWTEGLLTRLDRRIALYTMLEESLFLESEAFRRYYEQHGRILIEDPSLLSGRCDPRYPHWEKIREWRIASSCFRRF